jgi:hypothetical protein
MGSGFQTFASGLRTGTWGFGGLITLFSLTFLAGGIIITASHRLFGLITWIPDNVMKWIGHNPHALGEQDAEGKIRNSFGGFTSTMQNALNPRMTAGFRGKPGGGDKDQTDKTAALAAAQATATEQPNSQAKADTGTGAARDSSPLL